MNIILKDLKLQNGILTNSKNGISVNTLFKTILKSLSISYSDTCCNDIFLGNIVGGNLIVTNRQTASYILVLTDATKLVEMNVVGANTLTVPPSGTVNFPIGTQIMLASYGAGQTTVTAGLGVTINSAGTRMKLASQYSGASLTKIAADEWYIFGDLSL